MLGPAKTYKMGLSERSARTPTTKKGPGKEIRGPVNEIDGPPLANIGPVTRPGPLSIAQSLSNCTRSSHGFKLIIV